MTTTATSTLSATQTATTTLGSGATITGGTAGDSLYETGNDSTNSNGAGTNVRQYAFSNAASDYSTFTTTFSVSGSDKGTFTQTESDAPSFSTNGVITSGPDITTLTSTDTTTQTYSENGSRTVSWATGNYNAGSYSQTETTTLVRRRPVRQRLAGTRYQRHYRQRHRHFEHDGQPTGQPVGPGEWQRGRHRPGTLGHVYATNTCAYGESSGSDSGVTQNDQSRSRATQRDKRGLGHL